MKRSLYILPLISVFILIFASCRQKYFTSEGQIWATTYHIVYNSHSDLRDSIEIVANSINNSLSLFNPSSELSAINNGLNDVSHDFCRVFDMSQEVWRASNGVYDPTIAPLAQLWGFGKADVNNAPTDSAINAALQLVGLGDCSVIDGKLERKNAATRFDFSSIAKGYGVDRIADMLERNGCTDYMVEVGGEVTAKGVSPRGIPWRIQIDSPLGGMSHQRMAIASLGPERMAVASSGNYRNIRTDSAGVSWSHTISPITGRPVKSAVLATTIICNDCAMADAMATACMASMNADSALAIVKRLNAEALIAYVNGDSLDIVMSPGMKTFLSK